MASHLRPSLTWHEAVPPRTAAGSIRDEISDYKDPSADLFDEPSPRRKRPQVSSKETLTQKSHKRHDIRNGCIAGVVLSILLSIVVIVLGQLVNVVPQSMPDFIQNHCIEKNNLLLNETGTLIYQRHHYLIQSNGASSIIVVALVNIGLTGLLDIHGRVHTTALLWLLICDSPDKPRYNANSRLFNGTKGFGPCHWSMNIIAAITTALCYGATSSVVTPVTVLFPCDSTTIPENPTSNAGYGIDFSGTALQFLGFALLLQGFISTWTIINTSILHNSLIRTWSSNAVVNAIFLTAIAPSSPSNVAAAGTENAPYHQSLHQQVPRARAFVRVVWTFVVAFFGMICMTCYFAAKQGNFTDLDGDPWQNFGFVFAEIAGGSLQTDWSSPLIQAACQGCLAIAMHCADIVINFRNDEDSWQDAYKQYTKNPAEFTPRRFPVHVETWILFLMKAGVQTTFSFVLTIEAMFAVSLVPLILTTVLLLLIVIELEVLTRRTPTRGGPTTYGEFKILNNYISRYHSIWI